ncbi:MAG: methylmalonyl-CoA mutase small subunit [Rhodospirillaceae bacterium]|nr:methylmalonyl-CoA mutase small subunit [Rhodospirillaceae bacterium]
MSDSDLILGGEFAPVSYEDWVAEVEKVLKGAPFDKKMLHRTYDGITVQPIYTRDDWPADGDPSGFPGAAPFTRARTADGVVQAGWDIRQEAVHPDPAVANKMILTDLAKGTTSVLLRLDQAARAGVSPAAADGSDLAGVDGVMVTGLADLERALADVDLTIAPLDLEAGEQALPAAALYFALLSKRGVAAKACQAMLGADPIGALAGSGKLATNVETALKRMADLANYVAETAPGSRAVTVDTAAYHTAGASEAEDLAVAMATGVAYLRALTASGMSVDDAAGQIAFRFSVDCDFFETIAKLRAARRMWSRITAASGASEAAQAMWAAARTAERMMSRVDPWVNILRTSVAAFAAALGGADAITVEPYDAALGLPDGTSLRIARNIQHLLHEESSLNKVIDPSGGSWYVESLTDQLADVAWHEFQAIEACGGIVVALRTGHIAKAIDHTWDQRKKNLARRKDPLTGVSEFPNITEKVPAHAAPDLAALRTAASRGADAVVLSGLGDAAAVAGDGALTAALVKAAGAGATIAQMAGALAGTPDTVTPLPARRFAALFERLRDASLAHAAAGNPAPKIFEANIGSIAHHTGRATFAKNFFEVAGIEAVNTGGFSDAGACVAAFKDSGCRIAVLCSSDKLYGEHAVPFAQALKAAGCEFLFLAGAPGDQRDVYTAAGVDDFIFLGGNVLDTLEQTLDRLGVRVP